jgi:Anaphase-promoting complex subunit 4 WD40 domain
MEDLRVVTIRFMIAVFAAVALLTAAAAFHNRGPQQTALLPQAEASDPATRTPLEESPPRTILPPTSTQTASRTVPPAREPSGIAVRGRLVVPPGRSIDVSAGRAGVLLFLGRETSPDEPLPANAFRIAVDHHQRWFVPLREGDLVQAGQLLGRTEDSLARQDVRLHESRLDAAKAELAAAEQVREETDRRYQTQAQLYEHTGTPATSKEELRGAWLTYQRARADAESKAAAVQVAEAERDQAAAVLAQCDIRSPITGVVKEIYRHPGETAQGEQPGVLQVQNYDRLRVEALVDTGLVKPLRVGGVIAVKPVRQVKPALVFPGHRQEVVALAVGKSGSTSVIISASKDGDVLTWDPDQPKQIKRYFEGRGFQVRTLACTPPGGNGVLCLAGTEDGQALVWDPGAPDGNARVFQGRHNQAVTCAAFTSDGGTCATGCENGEIRLWDIPSGTLRGTVTGHRNAVTALQFTKTGELISADRDHSVCRWTLAASELRQRGALPDASHSIRSLRVSPDGVRILSEQGAEFRIWSIRTQLIETVLQPETAIPASARSLSVFSSDGRLALTPAGPPGVLQLWELTAPRAVPLLQLQSEEYVPATVAAFASDGSFVVAGFENGAVCLWPLSADDQAIHATVTTIEQTVESPENKVRLLAELDNSAHALHAGERVTMLLNPVSGFETGFLRSRK